MMAYAATVRGMTRVLCCTYHMLHSPYRRVQHRFSLLWEEEATESG